MVPSIYDGTNTVSLYVFNYDDGVQVKFDRYVNNGLINVDAACPSLDIAYAINGYSTDFNYTDLDNYIYLPKYTQITTTANIKDGYYFEYWHSADAAVDKNNLYTIGADGKPILEYTGPLQGQIGHVAFSESMAMEYGAAFTSGVVSLYMTDGERPVIGYNDFRITYCPNGEGAVPAENQIQYFYRSSEGTYGTSIRGCMFARDGYEFCGWNTDPNGNGTAYAPDALYGDDLGEDDLTLYAQWKKIGEPETEPEVPDDDTIKELLDQKVTVKCTNDANSHGTMSQTYGALVGGYEVGELKGSATDGYSVDVTIQCDTYVTQYNTDTKSKHVLESNESKTKTITLCYDMAAAAWEKPEQTVINVTCKVDKPDSPDDETVQELLKNKVLVKCVNTEAAHGEKTYDLENGTYQIGTVQGDEKTGYTVDVTITNSDYLTKFNTDLKAKHELASGEESTVTLRYVADSKTWKVDTNLPVEILVTCKVGKPGSPDDETVQELLKNKVLVKCVNTAAAHGEKTYDLENGTYQIGTVQGDEKTGYTVDVTITNSEYLAKFNTDLKAKHELVSEKESTVTLRYVADSKTWKVDTNLPVEILVTCKDVEDADIVVTPADMTIYRGGDATEETNSHVTIVDKDGNPMGNDGSLPEIGYSLKLSQELNERLHTALNLEPDAVLDLSKYITLTGKTTTGETLTWKLEPYGEGSSVSSTTKDGYFIYKITPTVGSDSAKLRVSFVDSDGNYVKTDAFNIEDDNTLDQTYRMKIYGDRVDASTLYATIKYDNGTSETVSVQGAEEPATLKVRYTEPDADVNKSFETVAQASEKEDGNDQTKLSNAYMIRGGVNDFMINNSNVQVSAGNVSLLVDDIAETDGTNFEETLEKGAVDAVKKAHPEVDTSKLQTAAKYMDLVDATNGNAWVTTKEKVTVYLPFPEGTDASTKFYVAHFDGLDREGSVSEITADVNKAAAELMGDVQADKYGISFTTNSFSPYVLVWDTTKNQPTPPSGGDNDNNNNNNNNNNNTNSNTNNNTQNTTVTVNNTASAAAPAAQAAAIPQTGDTMPVGLLGGVAVVAAAAFVVLLVIRKRKHND